MRGCFGIMSMIKTIRFLKRFAAKQVRPCSDEGATVDLVPRGEALNAKKPVKEIVFEIFLNGIHLEGI